MDLLVGFIVALAVGMLIGIERERRKRDPSVGSAGGLRTHVIAALAGAIAVQFPGVAVLVAGAVFVGALMLAAYWRSRSADPGLTSEITLFTTYLLGAMAPRLPELAAAIGVVIALLLALRSFLHAIVSRALSDREVLDLLLLAAAALVIWPLMPDRSIDRYGVINPQTLWELTLLVLMLNAVGYVALRRFGPTRGLPLAGFFGRLCRILAAAHGTAARSRVANFRGSCLPAFVGRCFQRHRHLTPVGCGLDGIAVWQSGRSMGRKSGRIRGCAFCHRECSYAGARQRSRSVDRFARHCRCSGKQYFDETCSGACDRWSKLLCSARSAADRHVAGGSRPVGQPVMADGSAMSCAPRGRRGTLV